MQMRISEQSKHTSQRRFRSGPHYPKTIAQSWYVHAFVPAAVLLISLALLSLISKSTLHLPALTLYTLLLALLSTMGRIAIAYLFAVVVALPLVFLIYFSPKAERILLPLYDIIESVPALAFFPAIVLFFTKFNFVNGAAIFIISFSMLWELVFSIVGGLTGIPNDIRSAAAVFRVKGFAEVKDLLLPAILPQLVTGSILAWAEGWNLIIVAEVLHTYMLPGSTGGDLFGIGSILVSAASNGQNDIFVASLVVLTLAIAILNFFVWQKLLQYAEHYKFD
ncbi:MAG: ABC transporter permease subunit [Candidatus Vogelbacteria bacterium]|nr:ABC transporter permease subunit [Candidatus Vogelbacteria bacterium]